MRWNRAMHSRPLMPPALENGRWSVGDTELEKLAACFVLNLEGASAGERGRGRALSFLLSVGHGKYIRGGGGGTVSAAAGEQLHGPAAAGRPRATAVSAQGGAYCHGRGQSHAHIIDTCLSSVGVPRALMRVCEP